MKIILQNETEVKRVLLMLSGGRDSFLSACLLLDKGYQVDMVTYRNGCDIQSVKAKDVADRIIKVYGSERASFLGVHSIVCYIRAFYPLFMNKTNFEMYQQYGALTQSQQNCLICRTSMYILSIILCKKFGISVVAEGGRRNQNFAIEQDAMLNNYSKLLEEYGIELLLPVQELNDDWKLKNLLLQHGFEPKTREAQCLLGFPMDGSLRKEVMEGVLKFYREGMYPIVKQLIDENLNNRYLMDKELPLYNEDELS